MDAVCGQTDYLASNLDRCSWNWTKVRLGRSRALAAGSITSDNICHVKSRPAYVGNRTHPLDVRGGFVPVVKEVE